MNSKPDRSGCVTKGESAFFAVQESVRFRAGDNARMLSQTADEFCEVSPPVPPGLVPTMSD